MEYVIVGALTFLVMFIVMKALENSNNRPRNQIIGISIVFALVVLNYCKDFNNVIKTILFFISASIAYGICIFLALRNTNFLRRAKFNKNKKEKKLLDEKMPSSSVLRKRYIISIVTVIIGVIVLIVITIYKFDVLILICSILALAFAILYTYQVVKMDVFKRDEPVRKLIIINRSNSFKVYSVTSDDKVFNTAIYLDKLREVYYVKALCKTFYYKKQYEIHNAYIIDSDSFLDFDFLKLEDDMLFYKKIFKEAIDGFAPYYIVSDVEGKVKIERIK